MSASPAPPAKASPASARVGFLALVLAAFFVLTLWEEVAASPAAIVPQAASLRSVVSCLASEGAGSAAAFSRAAPPIAAALVAGGGSGAAPFDAGVVADTMGLFGAFARAQRPHLSFKLDKNPVELTDRRHTFPLITGDGFRALADYVADRANEVSSLLTQLARDDTALFARLREDQALVVFLGNDDPTLNDFLGSTALDDAVRPLVLVVLNGDNDGLSPFHPALEHPRLLHVFTQNCVGTSEKVTCVPIGLENRQWSMHGWTPETLMGSMLGALRGPSPADRAAARGNASDAAALAFACFGVHTWPAERQPLSDMLGDRARFGWVSRACNDGLVKFHRGMLDAAAVIAPRGHGLDTLRAWEALYLGRAIVTTHSPMDGLWRDLPVIFLDRWDELSEARVLAGLAAVSAPEALAASRAATPRLFLPHWACEIGRAAKREDEFCGEAALLAAYTREEGA